jgi:hypothetical protein
MDPQESKYPGALAQIKDHLETLIQFSNFLLFLGKEMDTEGEITLRADMLITVAGRIDMAVDSIYYHLDPKWDEERAASRQEAGNGS